MKFKALALYAALFALAVIVTHFGWFDVLSVASAHHLHAPIISAGIALEIVGFNVTAPGAAPAPGNVSFNAGNTAAIRSFDNAKRAALLSAWAVNQAAGQLQIRSPRLHDNTVGIQAQIVAAQANPNYPFGVPQLLYPNDVLTVTLSGSAVGGQIEQGAFITLYDDLPGVQMQCISLDTLYQKGVNVMTVKNTVAAGAGGGWTGAQAINATNDQWKAGKWYALVGYEVDTLCGAVRFTGADTGNLGIGGPGNQTSRFLTADWFLRLARDNKRDIVPIFNANNKSGIIIDVSQNQAAAAVIVSSFWVELAPL